MAGPLEDDEAGSDVLVGRVADHLVLPLQVVDAVLWKKCLISYCCPQV